jgi:hypothetical protein
MHHVSCGFYQYSNGMALFTSNHPRHKMSLAHRPSTGNFDFSLGHAERQVVDDANGLGLRGIAHQMSHKKR